MRKYSFILDGDNVRFSLSSDLGFTDKDIIAKVLRVGNIAKLMCDAGNCYSSNKYHQIDTLEVYV